jgi:sterol desaturase/sphingolipid hydroxylase (fatty acid hydroxylase superfamily)
MAALGFASHVFTGIGAVLPWRPLSVGVMAVIGASLSPIDASLTWPFWIVGFVVYEFFYWVEHWAAHKVRLLWCMHSPHHAPRDMHLLIGANHSPLESVFYFPFFFGCLPALCGIHPLIAVAINIFDGIWGNLLHISHEVVSTSRYGILERFLQTPVHHRVHHAQNAR